MDFSVPKTAPMKTYTNRHFGFSMQVPDTWGTAYCDWNRPPCFLAPAQDSKGAPDPKGDSPAAIRVSVMNWKTPIDLQTAWDTKRHDFPSMSPGVMVAGTEGDTTLGGESAKTAMFTGTNSWRENRAHPFAVEWRQTMTLGKDGTSATILTVVSAEGIWNRMDPVFTKVEDSFQSGA